MIPFDAAHRAVHYPPDRRFRIWVRPWVLAVLIAACLLPVVAAYGQWLLVGLPQEQTRQLMIAT